MTAHLKKLWDCWIADRMHRKPHWKTWARLLASMPKIADQIEDATHYRIYKDRIEGGEYKTGAMPRGRWMNGRWLMRSIS